MIQTAEFKCSSERIGQVPKDELRDVAFIGRSNVGKSSLINMLTRHKGLAKVSATPGKTRLINHFLINKEWYLVDLPGYGYARTSKSVRGGFAKIITDYVFKCEKMHFLFVLVDSRLEPQRIDLEFIEQLGMNGVPFGIIFTKCDKLSKTQVERSVATYRKHLAEQWEEMPPMFTSSSEQGAGRDEILAFVDKILK
jgi:GTP-binding protein